MGFPVVHPTKRGEVEFTITHIVEMALSTRERPPSDRASGMAAMIEAERFDPPPGVIYGINPGYLHVSPDSYGIAFARRLYPDRYARLGDPLE